MSDFFKRVGVVGAGQMGLGIAQVFATAGIRTQLMDVKTSALDKAKLSVEKSLAKLTQRKTISSEQEAAAKASLSYESELAALSSCDLVIEAVIEDEKLKSTIFTQLDEILGPEAILASNTSSIPITRLAAATRRAPLFVGMHFMNPVPVMKLVEVISGMSTSPETEAKVIGVATEKLGKITVKSQDYPGFVVNRVLMPMINEAFRTLLEGVASAKDIDLAMKHGCNQPMGPLALADFIGLDTCLAILEVLHTGFGDARYAPCPLLRKYVEAGTLGVKSGKGVFTY